MNRPGTPRIVALTGLIALLAAAGWAPRAEAVSSFYSSQCASCHGSTPTTCNGCHQHGASNVSASLNKTSFAPGETMAVTVGAGTRTGWWRAALLNQTGAQVQAVSVASGTSTTITATAPTAPGTYTWKAGWYGNQEGGGGGSNWTADPGNPNHGFQTINLGFTVAAAAAPAIALNPTTINFGNVNVGSTGTQTAQIRNSGNAALTVSAIGRCSTPATSAEFAWSSPSLPLTVAAGATASLSVSYAPTAAGGDTGCLAITSNASNGPTTNLAVNGTGVVPAAPRIAISPTSLPFGNVTVGASSPRTFTISNTGNAALTGTVARASGTSAEFGASPASFNVAAGGSQVVTVTYAPTATGADSGAIAVSSNDATTPSSSVSVSGTGVAAPTPAIALNPTSLALGTVTVGGSASLTAQVQNTGTAALSVTGIAACSGTSAEFTWSPAGPFNVAAGGNTTLTVTYRPTAAGADTGCLAIASNDTARPSLNLNVSGTGQAAAAPRIAVSPTSVPFGNVTVGQPSAKTFTISNSGTAALTGSVARASGTSAEYAVSPASFNVAAGGSQVVTVTYTPTGANTDNGSVVVSSNDAASPTVGVTLSGAGVTAPAPAIALVPNALAFGTVALGDTASLTSQIRNNGNATLEVASIAACSGTSPELTWSPSGPLAVAPGQSATITVAYRPTAAGVDSGCIAIASNDASSPTVNLGLSGTGAAQAVPAIAVSPGSLDLGTVTVGSSASKTATIQNTGTGALSVSGITPCSGTTSEFGWSPAAPFTVAAGQSATVTVSYRPSEAGADSGCIAIASNDAAKPAVNLDLAGAGSQPPVPSVDADIDIDELRVPARADPRRVRSIRPRAEVKNRSDVDGSGSATLVATLDGATVYEQTLAVQVRARGEQDLRFPQYDLSAGLRGKLSWKLTVTDQDPDSDVATGTTYLARNWRGDDDDDEGDSGSRDDDLVVTDAAAGGSAGEAGGCSTGGGSTAILALLGLAALAVIRRARRA